MPDVVTVSRLDARKAAEMVGCKPSMIYSLAARKHIAHYRIGGSISFEAADVAAYLASARNPQTGREAA